MDVAVIDLKLPTVGDGRPNDGMVRVRGFDGMKLISFLAYSRCYLPLLRTGAFILGDVFHCKHLCSHYSSQKRSLQAPHQNSLYTIHSMLDGASNHCGRLSLHCSPWIHVSIR